MNKTVLQTRRDFCLQVCQVSSAFAFGGILSAVLQSCSGDNPVSNGQDLPQINATALNNTITITVDSTSPLASVGSAAIVQYSGGVLLVARTAQDAFSALTAICTHQGCTIMGYSNQTYICRCHGSQFDTNGSVKQGPASTSLRKFQTQFANNQLTISLI